MPILHIFIISILQGITEFLPISSSGHLLLFHSIVQQPDSLEAEQVNLLLDIAVHVGTLFAVVAYFWKDIWRMTLGCFPLMTGRWDHPDAKLNIHIVISSIPVIIAGFALHAWDPLWLRETWIVATTTIVFGALLWLSDARGEAQRGNENMTIKDAILIGLAQCLALIPGTSRSGITMTASRFLGFARTEAARYSLLLSTIAISGAGTVGAMDVAAIITPDLAKAILLAIVLSGLSAIIAIAVMMKWLEKQSFKVFAIYRFILGAALFIALGMGWIA